MKIDKSNHKINIILIYLNFLIFLINIYFIFNKIDNKQFFIFKNVENFLFLLEKSYEQISIYLNKHYFINKNIKKTNINFKPIKKIILIDCIDSLVSNIECINYLIDALKNKKNLLFKIDTDNPDYLIYDVFGYEHLNPKYNNSIKIAYYSENIIPDFNQADYSISQAHIIYLDRYFKYPSFIWRLSSFKKYDINHLRKEVLINPIRTKFCAAVISNNITSDNFRINFIQQLNKYKLVDMGGDVLNNVGGKVKNKIEFLSSYKFSISMENSNGDGYISEKIIESLIAGTIPIYYGDYMFDEYINPKAIILIKGEKDIPKKIEYIKKIDNDNELYNSIIKETIFQYNDIVEKIESEKREFLSHIFLQDKDKSKRIDNIN